MNRPWQPREQPELPPPAGTEIDLLAHPLGETPPPHIARGAFLRITIAIILLFWIAQFSFLTTMIYVRSVEDALDYLLPRALVTSAGILFSVGILAAQWAARRSALRRRAMLAALLALAGATLHGGANELVFLMCTGSHSTLNDFAWNMLSNLWLYMSVSVIVLALTYAIDLRERENRIAALRSVAHAAQLRALRFQLNPHFLFNALNSIASLISSRRNDEAESMTESLSDFLRSTMRLDPEGDITLGEEIGMQSLYLDIEKARFPERLIVELDVPEDLRRAAVPNLISQPLVENAVKYAVARSRAPVTVRIAAHREGNSLLLSVRDDGGDADAADAGGTKIGLANVAERLRLHFGDRASLTAQPMPPKGFEAVIQLPLRFTG
ncbi:MAG TPA: histidine kinase [Allosphingosinicella sp.]|jgi:hypothetical protein